MNNHFLKLYVKIRLKQIYRMFAEVGLGYLIILCIFAFVMLLALMESLSQNQLLAWGLLPFALSSSWHFRRLDYSFLKHLSIYKPIFYLSDYFILSFPFLILLAYFQNWETVIIGILGLILLAHLPTKKQEGKIFISNFNFIPIRFFEWRIGFRQNGWFLVVFYIVSFLGMAFEGTILLFSFLATMLISSFYDFCEPKEWINEKYFLRKKLWSHLGLWTLMLLPLMLCYIVVHSEIWYLALIAWYFGTMTIAFAIVYKYAHWIPNRGRLNSGTSVAVFIGMMLIVFTSPACIFAIFYYYRKAKNNPFLTC